MKTLKALCGLSLILFAPAIFAGSIQVPGLPGPIQVTTFVWEGANPSAKCLTNHEASFVTTGPAAAEAQLWQWCNAHQQVPQLSVDMPGEHHMLQQVTFTHCKNNGIDNPPTKAFTVRFQYCSLHIAPADAQVIAEGSPTSMVKLLNLRFAGKTGSITLQHDNFAGPGMSFFNKAYASKAVVPSVTIKVNPQAWMFTGFLVSSYQQAGDKETFTFSFNTVSGPPGGYQRP